MRATCFLNLFISGVLIALPLAAGAGPLDEQVKAAYATWNVAFNKGDAKAIASFYTSDASFLPATHDVIEGPEGVEKFYTHLFSSGVTDHTLDLLRVVGDDKILVAAARWSVTGKDASGAAKRFDGVAAHVFEKQADGSLKLKLHTFN